MRTDITTASEARTGEQKMEGVLSAEKCCGTIYMLSHVLSTGLQRGEGGSREPNEVTPATPRRGLPGSGLDPVVEAQG